MRINNTDKLIAYLTLVSGLTISAVAIYYSVAGLVAVFAAAVIPIIVMGVALEVSKLAATIWLKQNWSRAPNFIKAYLLAAILVLMLITSMGIFGFLSKAHSDQSLVSGDVQSKIAIIDEKIQTEKDNIDAARKALAQMDAQVNERLSRSTDDKGAERAVQIRRQQQAERTRLQGDISRSQSAIVRLNEEAAPIRAEVRKVEAEVGPIKYIAKLIYGDNPDANLLEKAVTWVIIIIVIVFDPLAVILLLASQYSFQWLRQQEEEDNVEMASDLYEIENLPKNTEQESVEESADPVWPFPTYEEITPKDEKTHDDPHPVGWMFPRHANIQEYRVEDADEEEPKFDEIKPLEQWEEPAIEDEEEILNSAVDSEKRAMQRWKQENPDSSLKVQKRLLERGFIKELPWMQYLKPQADFTEEQEAAVEAAKWAQEQLENKNEITWMENENGQQVKKSSYQQNAEQSERTIWQRIQDAKK